MREELRAVRTAPPPFRLVDEPPATAGAGGRRIPEQRSRLIDFARQHPGKWIEYRSSEEDPIKSASAFAGDVRRGVRGFAPKGTFEARAARDAVYLRYVGGDR